MHAREECHGIQFVPLGATAGMAMRGCGPWLGGFGLASTLTTHTQLILPYGTAAFTRRKGAVPRTHPGLFSSAPEPDFDPEGRAARHRYTKSASGSRQGSV